MGFVLFPGEIADSTYSIDFEELYREGIRGIIFDIDNTLVPHGAPADERAVRLFRHLKELGLACCLVSNNDEARVKLFNRDIRVHAVVKANKPGRRGYERAMELMGTDRASTIAIGDQIFTDIWGANRTGLRTIFVKQIARQEEIQIILKRIPEKLVLLCYRLSRSLSRGKERR